MSLVPEDRLALSDLVHRYAAAVDTRSFTEAAELFAPTAQLVVPEPPDTLDPVRRHDGRAGVLSALAALDAVTRTEHAIVGEVYSPGSAPGVATGRVVCIAHHWSVIDDTISDVVWHLHYDDEYTRSGVTVDDQIGWRISRRMLSIDAIETRSARRVRPR